MTQEKIREKINAGYKGKAALVGFESCISEIDFCKLSDGYYIYQKGKKELSDMFCHTDSIEGLVQFMQGALWFRLYNGKEIK